MIKELFFTAALLLPSLAYSANPSGDLSVQVVPPSSNGIACDIGPNYIGAIPGPAAAMGFTTCLNFDFTYTGTFSNRVAFTNSAGVNVPAGATWQWANQSSWLDSAGAASPLFHRSSGNNNGAWQTVTDSGTQVLLSQYIPGDNAPQINTPLFPTTNAFVEEVVRVNPAAYQGVTAENNGEIIDDFGFFGPKPGGTAALETDSGFSCALATPASWATASGQPCGGNGSFIVSADGSQFIGQPNYPPCCGILLSDGNFHTTGMLVVASRTNKTVGTCAYYDQQFAYGRGFGPCWGPRYPDSSTVDACTHEASVICYQQGTNGIGSYVTAATQNAAQHWIKRLTIWTCAGWNTPSGPALNSCDSGNKVFDANNGNSSGPTY
jgi:hypothetical protein